MLLPMLVDDYYKLLVQHVAAVAAGVEVVCGRLVELVYPRLARRMLLLFPAKLLKLAGQLASGVRVYALGRGE